MPDKVIDIPGVGSVAFPDTMDESAINTAAAKLFQEAQAKPPQPPSARTWGDTAADLAGGVRAGVANTVFGGGDYIRRAVGMERIKDEPDVQAMMTPPDSAAGKVGYYGEQLGEFFLPTGLVGKAGKAAEVLKSGALTMMQGGSAAEGGASAALTAGMGAVGPIASRVAGRFSEGAEKTMAQGLNPTKEWAKSAAAKIAPEMLARGVGGSHKAMLNQAKAAVREVGPKLTQAYKDAAAAGSTVSGDLIRGNIQMAADKFMVKLGPGSANAVPIAGTEGILSKLTQLDEFVAKLGPDIPVDKAAAIKTTWDQIVSKSGLYGQKATASATDNASAWAVREGAGSFRELLNANPTIAALNKEFSFWADLKKVLTATELRTQAQGGGLGAALTGAVGVAAGGASGDSMSDKVQNAVLGGLAGRQVVKLMQSPYWRTAVSAPLKNSLANALASGSAAKVEDFSKVLLKSLPAQLRLGLSE